jgi:transcription elongation factor GreA
MTLQALSPSARAALTTRLADLMEQREQALSDSTPPGGAGDAADRAGNIESLIRLGELDARIGALHVQLQAPVAPASLVTESQGGGVKVGSRVSVQFSPDESPEGFLVGLVEQAGPGVDVITPSSPLGKALIGARPGDEVRYRAANGAHLSATLVGIET